MCTVFPSSISLCGSRVTLRPLQSTDASQLVAAASDGALWNLNFTVVPDAESVSDYIATALDGRDKETMLPYAITFGDSGAVVGSTRFWKIDRKNRKLEIGHTWISESWQRSCVNTETKYLMLRFAFDVLCCVRVQFTTDELNERSRAAILRLGAVEEGLIRQERIMPDGRKRNSVRFSIIDSEWPQVRQLLEDKLQSMNIPPHFSQQ
jgi:RimJ/RimL family protein N-acetyltransferase